MIEENYSCSFITKLLETTLCDTLLMPVCHC